MENTGTADVGLLVNHIQISQSYTLLYSLHCWVPINVIQKKRCLSVYLAAYYSPASTHLQIMLCCPILTLSSPAGEGALQDQPLDEALERVLSSYLYLLHGSVDSG